MMIMHDVSNKTCLSLTHGYPAYISLAVTRGVTRREPFYRTRSVLHVEEGEHVDILVITKL